MNVDVCILSWNRPAVTLQAVASVRSQTGVEARVWLLDQGSDPECVAALREAAAGDPRLVLRELDTNVGVGRGRNLVMRMGGAPYIYSLDNDAEFAGPDVLRYAVERMDAEPRIAVLANRVDSAQTGRLDLLTWAYSRELVDHGDREFRCTRFAETGHCVRRSAFEEVGGYDERIFFCLESVDLSYKLIERGHDIVYDPRRAVLHKSYPTSRYHWGMTRFYHQVKNAIYLDWKFFARRERVAALAIAYLAKGLYNGLGGQAFGGVRDAIRVIRTLGPGATTPLGVRARRYLAEHDLRYRRSFVRRLRAEVFAAPWG